MPLDLKFHSVYGELEYDQVDDNWSLIKVSFEAMEVKLDTRIPLDNLSATADPTASNDSAQGYSVGSRWFNQATGDVFVCTDPGAGAAVWVQETAVSGSLGSAAFADVTGSATDITAGRLLKVGDFGVGSNAPVFTGDMNTLLTSGFWSAENAANAPSGFTFGVCIVVVRSGASFKGYQIYMPSGANSERVFIRNYHGAWSAWREVYHQASILGTVSQSGGIPTGAIIERGSNANGEYVKYADGTMICSHSITHTSINLAADASSDQSWTYPAAFASIETVHVTGSYSTATVANCRVLTTIRAGSLSLTDVSFVLTNLSTVVQGTLVSRLFAKGRWF